MEPVFQTLHSLFSETLSGVTNVPQKQPITETDMKLMLIGQLDPVYELIGGFGLFRPSGRRTSPDLDLDSEVQSSIDRLIGQSASHGYGWSSAGRDGRVIGFPKLRPPQTFHELHLKTPVDG